MKRLKLTTVIAGIVVATSILTANSKVVYATENDTSQENVIESNQTTGAAVSTQTTDAAVSDANAVTTLEASTNEEDFAFDADTGTILKYNGSDTDVVIPNEINGVKVKCIGEKSFENLSNITSVSFPEGITEIGNHAFIDCLAIKSIDIPESVTSIGKGAFGGCESMKSINIPDSVTSIGDFAFYACISMESIKLPNKITCINDELFMGCKNLSSVNIPDSVTNIGTMAFRDCENLTNIIIPRSVTLIESEAFSECYRLENISVVDDNENYSSADGIVFSKSKNQIKIYPAGKKDKSYIIPQNIDYIESYAFADCSALENVEMPDSVTYLGEHAFEDCTNLINIKISNKLTTIGYGTFWYCTNLKSIIIPDGVTNISSALGNCSSLTSITIPSSVSVDGGWGFEFFTDLKYNDITIYIDSEEQKDYLIEQGVMKSKIILNGSPIDERDELDYEIDPHTGTITKYKGSIYVQDIVIPSTINGIKVKAIKDTVFSEKQYPCVYSITIPNGVTSIKSNSFDGCRSAAIINLPDSIKSIGDGTFLNFYLINMTLPKDLKSISNQTFKRCDFLTSVVIPNGVKSIGDEAFEDCSSLKKLKIPSSVKKIGKEAFANCTNLESVTVSDSVNKIEESAFDKCDNATFYVNSKKAKKLLIKAGVNKNKIIIKMKRK